ncbi:MAG: alanine racemase, partial [Oscillospiraceae bacterium]|nr:alanine racemase [Oscillospiraceae bacterium]
MDYLKRTWADISLDHLEHNYNALRGKVSASCRFMGVVKADAYGHGAVPISRRLVELGAEYLAVSNLQEAEQLRYGGIRGPILILGYTPAKYAEELVKAGLRQEVHSLEYAKELNDALKGTNRRLRIHLKLDTGMSRLGFFAYGHEESLDELKEVARMEQLVIEGVFTHFPVADSIDWPDRNFTRTQFDRFNDFLTAMEGVGIRPEIRHCCNSGASIQYPEYAMDMIRPGIVTYGYPPDPCMADDLELKPLLTLKTTVAQIRDYPADIAVSYGRTWKTSGPTKIATLTIGYADGLDRRLSSRVKLLLRGKPVQQVGRICMDMCMVDISNVPEAEVG